MREPDLPRPPLPSVDALSEDLDEQRQYLDEAMYACCMSIRGLLIMGSETLPLRLGPLDTPLDAVLVGLLVRCYKLYDSLLMLVLDGRHEIALILLRALVDSVVNITYMSRATDPEATTEAFVRSARAYDEEGRKDRGGPSTFVAPGEDRVVGSVLRHLACTELAPGSVSASDKRWSGDAGAKARAESVGLLGMYRHSFAAGSHAVHGDWNDLYAFHLAEIKNATFIPHLDYRGTQLAILEVASSLAVAGLREVALPRAPESTQVGFADLLAWLDAWLRQFDAAVVPTPRSSFDPVEHQRSTALAYLGRLFGSHGVAEDEESAAHRQAGLARKAVTESAIEEWFKALNDRLVP
jgi:Family of unknown function (DUF5677)